MQIRPSSDRLREAVFNILGATVRDAHVLDLYAGTGSLGIEAMSRGAQSAVFVDKYPDAITLIHRNLNTCSLETSCRVFQRDITLGIDFLATARRLFDLVFLDPPYEKGLAKQTLHLLSQCGFLSRSVDIVVEHSVREELPELSACFARTDQRRYGKALVSFYAFMV